MAIDPTAGATGGPGGWGLGALGAPSVSTAPIAPRGLTLTPDQIAQLRRESMELQTPPKQNIQSWTQGLAELVRAIQGNREADFARQQELQGRQQGAEDIGKIYAPYLSPGGTPTPPGAGAAPAGTQGTGPAGAVPSMTPPTTTADASMPRGFRNNNPLNIEDGPFAQSQPGYAGSDGRFAKFETQDHGTAAASSLLDIYGQKHGLNTIAGIVGRWAPASDNNNTQAYAADVARQLGIGPNDPIPPAMRPQLIAAMARHENGRPLPTAAAAATAPPPAGPQPSGLLAPIPAATTPPAPTPVAAPPQAAAPPAAAPRAAADPRVRLAYSGDTIPPGMVSNAASQGAVPSSLSPIVNAIAGRPVPPPGAPVPPIAAAPPPPQPGEVPDFAKQAAILAAGGSAPSVPLSPAGAAAAVPPPPPSDADFAARAAALASGGGPTVPLQPVDITDRARQLAADRGQSVPMSPDQVAAMGLPITVPPKAAAPPLAPPPLPEATAVPPSAGPVPVPAPRPTLPLPRGSAIPGAVGPTSVGGTVLAPPITAPPSPYANTPSPAATPTLVNAIAGRDMPAAGAPPAAAPVRVAQNGPPTSAVPVAAGGPAGLPTPLTSATGQVTQEQLTRVLANPWVPEQAKAAMLQMIQQRGQPQIMDVEGGKLMYNAAGQKVFIPEPRFGTVEIGSSKIPTVSHFDPVAGRWNTTTLAPGGGVQTQPGAGGAPGAHPAQAQSGVTEPDLSTIGGIQAEEARQKGAVKGSEEAASQRAKTFNTIYTGVTGDAFNASRQEPIIDTMARIAPAAFPGAGSDAILELHRVAAQFGLDPNMAAPRELFNQLSAKLLGDQFANIRNMSTEEGSPGGKIFKSMLDLEEKANITPQDSLPGVQAKLAFMKKAGQMLQRWGDLADDYRAAHKGELDEGFMKGLRHDLASQNFDDILPQADPSSPTGMRTGPTPEQVEAELRKRGKLPPAGPAAAPVSR